MKDCNISRIYERTITTTIVCDSFSGKKTEEAPPTNVLQRKKLISDKVAEFG